MKGIVFALLQAAISDKYGEDTWDAVVGGAGVDGAYTAVGTYPHEEFLALVGAASEVLGAPAEEVARWFGRTAIPLLYQAYPRFFDPHRSTRSFLLTLNDIIHPEVRKLYPGAEVPEFAFDTSSDDALNLRYRSSRKLCHFGEGLVQGAAAHFGEEVTISQPECSLRGDSHCLLVCLFRPAG